MKLQDMTLAEYIDHLESEVTYWEDVALSMHCPYNEKGYILLKRDIYAKIADELSRLGK